MRRHLSIGLVAAACAIAGCGGDDSSSDNGYPKEAETNFVNSCSSQPGANREKCQCAYDHIKAKLSFDEFKKADTALREGKDADPKATKALQDSVNECK
jgi:hypothetical protein